MTKVHMNKKILYFDFISKPNVDIYGIKVSM